MTEKIRISLDLESVLADTHQVYLDELNTRYGTDYEYDDVDSWDWVCSGDRDFEEFMEIVQGKWKDEWWNIPTCEPWKELRKAVGRLSHDNEIHIVTAREGVEPRMQLWCFSYGLLQSVSDFRSVSPDVSKPTFPYDVFIDDKPQLTENISSSQHLFLIDQPWNQNVSEVDNVTRVQTVVQAVEIIQDTEHLID